MLATYNGMRVVFNKAPIPNNPDITALAAARIRETDGYVHVVTNVAKLEGFRSVQVCTHSGEIRIDDFRFNCFLTQPDIKRFMTLFNK